LLRSDLASQAVLLLHNLENGPLAVARRRTGEERSNCVNRLATAANDSADIASSKLQLEHGNSAVRNFGQHHIVRKFYELMNDEFEKLPHA